MISCFVPWGMAFVRNDCPRGRLLPPRVVSHLFVGGGGGGVGGNEIDSRIKVVDSCLDFCKMSL